MKQTKKKESVFQYELKREIERTIPGSIVLKLDPTFKQGFPDLLILFRNKWALLEVKKTANAHHQPNQDYYVDICNKMSFARFIYPENKEEVLNGLRDAFKLDRPTRLSRS